MSCKNCAYMNEVSLPDCSQEVASLAYRDCEAATGQFMDFVAGRFPTGHRDRDFDGHWKQLAHVRREHIEFHRQRGDSCERIDRILAEQKGRASR